MDQKSFLSLGNSGFHRISYIQWLSEKPTNENIICVHGLTRNCRDFDPLAQALQQNANVYCPDIAGRGQSDWLLNPQNYGFPTYMADMAAFMSHIRKEKITWLGTSMGGLIGMMLAAYPNSPIEKLILNDVGPYIPYASLAPIAQYVKNTPEFDDPAALEAHLRLIHAGFGPLSDEEWKHLAQHSTKHTASGKLTFHYDPQIAVPMENASEQDVDLWPVWEQIKCPVLIIRGEHSPLLTKETADEMLKRGPDAELIEIPQSAHAPALMSADEIKITQNWITNT